jgi:hypothetical protein
MRSRFELVAQIKNHIASKGLIGNQLDCNGLHHPAPFWHGTLNDVAVQQLRALYNWMFVPPTLWPFNVQDVLENCLAALEKGKCLNSRHRLLIELLSCLSSLKFDHSTTPKPRDKVILIGNLAQGAHPQLFIFERLVK